MATQFGKPKKSNSISASELTANQLLGIHTQFVERPFDDWEEHNKQKIMLAMTTVDWFSKNSPSLNNAVLWGDLLSAHIENSTEFVNAAMAKPVADYFTYISTLSESDLFAEEGGKSPRYDSFCKVVHMVSSSALWQPSEVMVTIAENEMMDLDALMRHLRTMRSQQYNYDIYTLDNPGEFEEIPEGILMRTLLGMSFTGNWTIPLDNPTYHDMWDVIDDDDTVLPTQTYDAEYDIIAHLVTALPCSTYDALEYFEYHVDKLQAHQQQHILGMDLSYLEFPQGLQKLIDAVYFNEFTDTTNSEAILTLMNPAAHVLRSHLDLYDTYEDAIKNLGAMSDLKGLFSFSNSMRQTHQANAIVEKIGFTPGDS